jgi:hypothetical protein
MRGIQTGLFDLVLARGNEEELKGALAQWPEPVSSARAQDFSIDPGAPVPLITSPNLLPVDRIALAALAAANCRYEVVFTAFDTMARRAAVAAGLGYCATTRSTVSAMAPLVIEETAGVLPDLGNVMNGILARDDSRHQSARTRYRRVRGGSNRRTARRPPLMPREAHRERGCPVPACAAPTRRW